MRKMRGSAILIAIFLITAIAAVAFSFGRLFLMESTQFAYYENGIGAYFSAESGIEEGMLRYKYDRQAEVPFVSWKLGQSQVFRSNITTAVAPSTGTGFRGVNKYTTAISTASSQYYDLRSGFIGTDGKPFYGIDENSSNTVNAEDVANSGYSLTIPQDETYKITFPKEYKPANATYYPALYIAFPNNLLTDDKKIVYVKIQVKNASDGIVKEYKKMVAYNIGSAATLIGGDAATDFAHSLPTTIGGVKTVAVEDLFNQIGYFQKTNDEIVLSIQPLYQGIKFGLTSKTCSTAITSCMTKIMGVPGPFYTITSTGYYAGTTRTLEAKVDQQNGTLYDLFDYVLYKAS